MAGLTCTCTLLDPCIDHAQALGLVRGQYWCRNCQDMAMLFDHEADSDHYNRCTCRCHEWEEAVRERSDSDCP